MLDGKAVEGGAGRRIDAGDPRRDALVAHSGGEEARRVSGADLDDPARPLAAHERVGRRRIEARKPGLVEARRPGAGGERRKALADAFDRVERRFEARRGFGKQRAQGGIVPWRDAVRVAVGDEEAAAAQAENGREAEDGAGAPAPAWGQISGAGGGPSAPPRLRQALASLPRSNIRTTTIDIANGIRR